MTNQRPIVILDEYSRDIGVDYDNAFVTKKGKEKKKEYDSSQSRFMERQLFPPNTWLMDFVRFDNGAWFCWFIEANTRYLIPIEGNGTMIT